MEWKMNRFKWTYTSLLKDQQGISGDIWEWKKNVVQNFGRNFEIPRKYF